jgi:hypothetical protein
LFKNKENKTVGKVAVFINNYQQKQPTGGIGFFDCINDQETANFIFDHCKNWLQKKEWKQWTDRLISGSAINSGDW